jgi:hypothetical protein
MLFGEKVDDIHDGEMSFFDIMNSIVTLIITIHYAIGTFELNWADAAQNWYKAKKRHSRFEDASHLLHKGLKIA